VSSGQQRVVGIDLGTTHTVAAWAVPGQAPTILPIPQLVAAGQAAERPLLPSFLYAPLDDEPDRTPHDDRAFISGELAERRGREVPSRSIASAKSWLCHGAVDRRADILPWGVEDASVPRLSPVAASARLLAHVTSAYEHAARGRTLRDELVVLTVPASFDQAARELTLLAAKRANLRVRLLEEPQAAFYDYLSRRGERELDELLDERGGSALILVCDIGGGTTDLSLVRAGRTAAGKLELTREAVGRHLLLGGDNIDLALAHILEARLETRLEPLRFAQLSLLCRHAKEQLLADDPPPSAPITLLGSGSALFGGALRAELSREEVERMVFEGFLPPASRDAEPERGRGGLVAFGLPYERDPRISHHLASFLSRHARGVSGPDAVLYNGGFFRSARLKQRLTEIIASWGGPPLRVLEHPEPELAVARGAASYALSLLGHGLVIGGGAAHGYYLGLGGRAKRQALCVVPRGSREGERNVVAGRTLELTVGKPVRFELYASDSGPVHAPGEVVAVDGDLFEQLPPVAACFESDRDESAPVRVHLEGELTAIGTLELACVEQSAEGVPERRFPLVFELRGTEPELDRGSGAESARPGTSGSRGLANVQQAYEAIQRVFGKGRTDVRPREVKDLLRELERLLGERGRWNGELARSLFDVVAPKHKARRRTVDHERVYWMLAGYCLRPGFGHPLDPQRIAIVAPLFSEGVTFAQETRNHQHFYIAWRRMAGGLDERMQRTMRDLLDPFLAPPEAKLKKPKSFRALESRELIELVSFLERVPHERRSELGRWLLERTWSDRDPLLWQAIGRIGARVPVYASAHHVVAPRVVERWLDHLLREKWQEMPTAPRAAFELARATGDRARDLPEAVRAEVARRLELSGSPAGWALAVREPVPVEAKERAEAFGEELPLGLRLLD
jgi:molecular chaperone DnaK (HSP70)